MNAQSALDVLTALTSKLSPAAQDVIDDLCDCSRHNGAPSFYKGAPAWILEAEDATALLKSLKDALCDGGCLEGMEEDAVKEAYEAVDKQLAVIASAEQGFPGEGNKIFEDAVSQKI